MSRPTRWTVALDETEAAWNSLGWVETVVRDADSVRLVTVHEQFGESRERSTGRLTIATHLLRDRHPHLEVAHEVVSGPTVARLVTDAVDGDVLVVGGRHSDRLWACLTGRVTERVVAHVTTPVVVVPERWRPGRDEDAVVVGVDGGTAASALAVGAVLAEGRRDGLVLVRAWRSLPDGGPFRDATAVHGRAMSEHDGQLELDAAIRWVSRVHPDLRMRAELRQGTPSEALARAGRTTALIVVGRRHRTAVGAFLGGSVGEALVHRSSTPLCVVPQWSVPPVGAPTAPPARTTWNRPVIADPSAS